MTDVIIDDRTLFSKYLEQVQKIILNYVLDSNNEIIQILPPSKDNSNDENISSINSKPIWMISGGTAINLYSFNHTKTKDLDLKILCSGDYSLDKKLFEKYNKGGYIPEKISSLKNGINWNTTNFTLSNLNKTNTILTYNPIQLYKKDAINGLYNDLYSSWNKQSKNDTIISPSHLFETIENQKNLLVSNILNEITKDGSQIRFMNKYEEKFKLSDIITIIFNEGFDGLSSYVSKLGDGNVVKEKLKYTKKDGNEVDELVDCIPIIVKLPFFTYGGNLSSSSIPFIYPYIPIRFDDSQIKTDNYCDILRLNNISILETVSFGDIISMISLYRLAVGLNTWYDITDESVRKQSCTDFLRITKLMKLDTYLLSAVGMIIKVYRNPDGKEKKDDWGIKISYEGVLDLFIDYAAGNIPNGKKIYEGKNMDGSIPSIIQTIKYGENNNKNGYIKLPTYSWLLRDQIRMLSHSIIGKDTTHRGWTDDKFVFDNSKIDPKKYFLKVLGMTQGLENIINILNEGVGEKNGDDVQEEFRNFIINCGNDVLKCGPDSRITILFQNFNKDYWKLLTDINVEKNTNTNVEKKPVVVVDTNTNVEKKPLVVDTNTNTNVEKKPLVVDTEKLIENIEEKVESEKNIDLDIFHNLPNRNTIDLDEEINITNKYVKFEYDQLRAEYPKLMKNFGNLVKYIKTHNIDYDPLDYSDPITIDIKNFITKKRYIQERLTSIRSSENENQNNKKRLRITG